MCVLSTFLFITLYVQNPLTTCKIIWLYIKHQYDVSNNPT